MISRSPYREFEKTIGYRFRRREWLRMALTHRSYRFEAADVVYDNQRLEFLGDAVLGLLAAEDLYERLPDLEEGELTRRRSEISSGKALARLGRDIGIGTFLVMGRGEERSGGRERASNLADAVEAVLAAAYLDGGIRAARRIFRTCFAPRVDVSSDVGTRNAKGALQEYCQRELKQNPVYRLVSHKGPAHDRHFLSEVRIGGEVRGRGDGPSKQASEVAAAREALQAMGIDD